MKSGWGGTMSIECSVCENLETDKAVYYLFIACECVNVTGSECVK